MAAVVECDACRYHFGHEKIIHIRTHKLTSADQYLTKAEEYFDLCPGCYRKIKTLLDLEKGRRNDNTATIEALT